MATMLDVSRHAGVSKATVSRVLNGTGQVKESTRQKVFTAMQALDYRPNLLARSLANRTNNSIGLVVSTFDGFYFGSLLRRASRQAELHNKQLIVTDGHDTPEREQKAVQMLADRQCDAIILYTRYMDELAILSLIDATEMPLVIINRNVTQARDRAIFFEQETAAFQAVEYLITQGHRDIACITLPVHTPTGTSRVAGYRKALEKYGIPWQPAKALRQAGLRIPQDVSLFGFDDAPGATWLEPGLSTVYLPIEDMIATAIDQAVRLANSEPVAPIPPFTGTLILRESVSAGPFFQRPA